MSHTIERTFSALVSTALHGLGLVLVALVCAPPPAHARGGGHHRGAEQGARLPGGGRHDRPQLTTEQKAKFDECLTAAGLAPPAAPGESSESGESGEATRPTPPTADQRAQVDACLKSAGIEPPEHHARGERPDGPPSDERAPAADSTTGSSAESSVVTAL